MYKGILFVTIFLGCVFHVYCFSNGKGLQNACFSHRPSHKKNDNSLEEYTRQFTVPKYKILTNVTEVRKGEVIESRYR